MSAFARYVGIDYSGAETPNASLKGLRVYLRSHNAGVTKRRRLLKTRRRQRT